MVQRSIKLFSHRCVRIGHVPDVRLTLANKHRSSTICMLAQTRWNRLWRGRGHRRLCQWWAGPVRGCRLMQASRVGKTKRLQMRPCSSPLAPSTRCTPSHPLSQTTPCRDQLRKWNTIIKHHLPQYRRIRQNKCILIKVRLEEVRGCMRHWLSISIKTCRQ